MLPIHAQTPPPARSVAGGSDGRFAPSPTGDLHLGNLRTALLAWLFARSVGGRFLVRIEDLDPDRLVPGMAERHLRDLELLELTWDGTPIWQSGRTTIYHDVIDELLAAGKLYRCYCTRAEIHEAASAPHGPLPEGAYAGTCRALDAEAIAAHERAGHRSCLRLRGDGSVVRYVDRLLGEVAAIVDDFVVVRKDGVPAYNLAVVVDDHNQGIGEVVRGADLAENTPRQLSLYRTLGWSAPTFAHVPLMIGPDRRRLSKRHGDVTMGEWLDSGRDPAALRSMLARSVGLAADGERPTMDQLLKRFDPSVLRSEPTIVPWFDRSPEA